MYKNLEYVSTKDMPHETWLEERTKGIGGSDAATVAGLNEFSSPYSLWAEKTGKTVPADLSDKEAVRLGTDLEQYVAKRWEEKTGKKVRRCNNIIRNPEIPFAHANVDRLVVGEDAGLECKTSSSWDVAKQCREGEIPNRYYVQCVHYMMVTGASRWYLGVLCFGVGFFDFTVERDESEISALKGIERDFWEHVLKKTPPAADGSSATTDAINEIYNADDGSSIELFGFEAQLQAREALKAQIKELKEQADSIDNDIKLQMGSASRGTCGKWTVSWSTTSRTNFDYKKFKEDNPTIDLTRYEKDSSSRTLRITEKKR